MGGADYDDHRRPHLHPTPRPRILDIEQSPCSYLNLGKFWVCPVEWGTGICKQEWEEGGGKNETQGRRRTAEKVETGGYPDLQLVYDGRTLTSYIQE